ncbi:MAG: permease prefix domain 1-containing protein [Streptosporangiaceae bacterium]
MSEIERYLDELFDRLAGQGGAGRQALAEVEDHLRAAAADAVASGLAADQAEHDAITRFGSAAAVARQLRAAHGARRLNRALSTGWLLTGLTCAGLGAAYLVAARRLVWQPPGCAPILTSSCYVRGHIEVATSSAAIAAVAGTALLLGRWLAVKYAGLAPARRGFAFTAAMLLVLAAVVLGTMGWPPAFHVLFLQWRPSAILIATALTECIAVGVSLADSRPRYHMP